MGWLVCWLVYVKSTMIIYNVGMFFSLQFIIFSLIFKIINCSPMSYCIPISHNVHPSLQLWFKERVSSKIDFYLKPAQIFKNVRNCIPESSNLEMQTYELCLSLLLTFWKCLPILTKSYTGIDEIVYSLPIDDFVNTGIWLLQYGWRISSILAKVHFERFRRF